MLETVTNPDGTVEVVKHPLPFPPHLVAACHWRTLEIQAKGTWTAIKGIEGMTAVKGFRRRGAAL